MESSQYIFTDVYRHTSPSSCQFSPGTTFFAVAVEDHVIVRVTDTMQLVRTWACRTPQGTVDHNAKPEIRQLVWSPDSSYIMASAPRTGTTWVFGLTDSTEHPRAVVQAGIEGLVRSEWSPDSTAILCFSEQRVRKSLLTSPFVIIPTVLHDDHSSAFRSTTSPALQRLISKASSRLPAVS